MYEAQQAADAAWLFDTRALEISAADSPFWYTSGLIGPYYINTHYLCGGKDQAVALLSFIDENQANYRHFPRLLSERVEQLAAQHPVYRDTIEAMSKLAQQALPAAEISFVSGGQRRDWFFAPFVARKLGVPCLYLYNDLSIYTEQGERVQRLDGAKILNVADLLTVGSSYTTKWIPAVEAAGARLCWSLNGVDRRQGGEESLREAGLEACVSLFSIDRGFFERALERQLITEPQFRLVAAYLEDPFASMQRFLQEHPAFLKNALASADEKTRGRAKTLVEQDLYKLGSY